MALAGYRNLDWLKARLLPADMDLQSTHDAALESIGLGVAAQFDRYTGRTLRRTVGHTYETPADSDAVVVDLYPIEAVTAAQLIVHGQAATDVSSAICGTHGRAGIVRFVSAPGGSSDVLRLTLTGGFWCQDGAETQPSGSTAIPAELLNAWVQQVRAICEAENLFRSRGATAPDKKGNALALDALTLLPGVRATLQLFIRAF